MPQNYKWTERCAHLTIFYRHTAAFTTSSYPSSISEHAVSVPSLYLIPYYYTTEGEMTGNCRLTVTPGGICMKLSAIICTVMVDNNLSHRLTAVTANAPLITTILCWDRDAQTPSQSLCKKKSRQKHTHIHPAVLPRQGNGKPNMLIVSGTMLSTYRNCSATLLLNF